MSNNDFKIQDKDRQKTITWSKFLLITIIIVSLAVRLFYFPFDVPITLDGIDYFSYAVKMSQIGNFPNWNTPNNGWPSFISLFFSLYFSENFLDYMNLQKMLSVVFSVMTIIPVYLLCTRFFDKYYAVLGSILFAFEPRLILNSLDGIIDPLYIFIITAALFLYLSKNSKFVILSFAIFGLATIVRYEGFLFIIPISIMFFVRFRKEPTILLKYFLGLSIFLIIVLSWSYLQFENTGTFSTLVSIYNGPFFISHFVIQGNPDDDVTVPGDDYENKLSFFLIQGIELLSRYLIIINIPYFFFFVPYGIIIVAKNYLLKKYDYKATTIILFVITFLVPAAYAYGRNFQDPRYLYTIFPIFCLLAMPIIRMLHNKINDKNLIFAIIFFGVIFSSIMFIEFEKIDRDLELEIFAVATYLINHDVGGINNYEGGKYLKSAEIQKNWPIIPLPNERGHITLDIKRFSATGFTLKEFIQKSRNEGLTHLVIYKDNTGVNFLEDVFSNEKDYPYLIKEFDSANFGYKSQVKIFRINYQLFDSITNS